MMRAKLKMNRICLPISLAIVLGSMPVTAASLNDIETLKDTNVCENCDLSHADLSDLDLTGANLTGSNMIEVKLTGSNLTDANLTDVMIESSSLREATLCNTTRGADWVDNRDC